MTELGVLSWNLFHGRDAPPNSDLFTRRARLLRHTEEDGQYVQVNRALDKEFADWIASRDWHLCCLQECPPRWGDMLAQACDAQALRVLTSRNALSMVRKGLARWNPDLMASGEGGSNLILVRRPWSVVAATPASLALNPFPARGLRERRVLGSTAIESLSDSSARVMVGNFHASANRPDLATREVLRAARFVSSRAGSGPAILAGDFNLRPFQGDTYESIERETGLLGITHEKAIDHILQRGLEVPEPPRQLEAAQRELNEQTENGIRKLRLSDHAPLVARFIVK